MKTHDLSNPEKSFGQSAKLTDNEQFLLNVGARVRDAAWLRIGFNLKLWFIKTIKTGIVAVNVVYMIK